MIKSLLLADRSERERFAIPSSVQKSIPIRCIHKDGIFQVGGKYSRTWRFADINYAVASHDDQTELFMGYCALLNSLPTDATTKITIANRRINAAEFERSMLMGLQGDELDRYRAECNANLSEKAGAANNLVQEKYITVSAKKQNIEEARGYFRRVDNDLGKGFAKLDSGAKALGAHDRLRLFHDFFRPGEEQYFRFDLSESMRLGHDFRDFICPDSLVFKADHFLMGGKVGRVLFLRDYPSYLKDSMISDLSDFSRNLILSIDLIPVPTDEAVKEMQTRMLAVETDITRFFQKNTTVAAVVPYGLEQLRQETKEYMDDLTSRDQRMVFGNVTLVHIADSIGQLDADTETLQSIGRKYLCQFAVLRYQQEDGLNTALPYGLRRIKAVRTLTTESAAVLMPFNVQDVMDVGGNYYGQNAISRNIIVCNRKRLLAGHGFILGITGSGKSFAAKQEMVSNSLATEDDIILVDPEREYGPLVSALGGEVIQISATSSNYINALDMAQGYGDRRNPVVLKSEFIMSLCEQLTGALTPTQRSIIDRCTTNVYRGYIRDFRSQPPTLMEFYDELRRQPEQEAAGIALALELFTHGNLNVFSHQTNVNTDSRILCYDLYDLGETLKPLGLLVMLDSILNRVIRNRAAGRYTHIYIDEIYLYFAYQYSASFLFKCWKRFRKYGGIVTGITQNVEECLRSDTARLMFANSEFLLLFNQAATDRAELAGLLHISETQMSHITNAEAGHGLLKVGASLIPFKNDYPRHTDLYKLMSTSPGGR